MQKLSNLSQLWQQFFISTPQTAGTDSWSITFIARDKTDVLISLANPFTEENEEVFVADVSDNDLQTFTEHYKARFSKVFQERFGFFRPEVDNVLTEYPDWRTFYDTWINNDPTLLQANMPLMFDYPSADEYRAMQLKGSDFAGYRRLMVVIYQYRKQQFHRIFIKEVDEQQYASIQQQMIQLVNDSLPRLIYTS